MRGRVDQRYLEQAAQILQLVHNWGEPMSTLALSFACEDNPVVSTMAQMTEWAPLEKTFRLQELDRRLQSRWVGLLEIHGPAGKTNGLFECRVEFIDRTAKEYLEKTQVWNTLLSETAGSPFKVDLWLLSSWILQIKVLEPEITDIAYYIDRPTRFQDLLSQIVVIAARAEKSTRKAQVELLEEPDR